MIGFRFAGGWAMARLVTAMIAALLLQRASGVASAAEPAETGLHFRLVAEADDKSEVDEMPDPSGGKALRVLKPIVLDQRDIARAYETKTTGGTAVGIDFSAEGGKKLEKVTTDNINHRLAMILDGKVLSAPRIRSTIAKSLVLTGGNPGFTDEKVKSLVDSINASLKDVKPVKPD
jgi:preprotein translocase subunit SecD